MRKCGIVVAGSLFVLAASAVSGQSARFGGSIVVGEGEIIVGEEANNLRPGTVYVFGRGSGGWRETAQLRAPDAEVRDGFGGALARSGTTLFVRQRDVVQLFGRRADGSWRHTGQLTAPAGAAAAQFGAALAASGDWLLVGAPGAGGGFGGRGGRGGGAAQAAPPGTVHVYRRDSGGAWRAAGVLRASDSAAGDRFGAAVALADGRAVIGAPGRGDNAGVAYEFRLDAASGTWREASRLTAAALQANDAFGAAVAFDGRTAVIGAPGHGAGAGAAFVFRSSRVEGAPGAGGAWSAATRLVAFAGGAQDRFGTAVAVNGDDVFVGAPTPGPRNTGSVYVFHGDDAGFDAARRVALEPTDPADRFGQTVVLAGGTAAVAATGKDHGAGSVAVYARANNGEWRQEALLESEDEALDAVSGNALRCGDTGTVGSFECGNVELLSFLPVSKLVIPGSNRGSRLNDMWGWTDEETGREYALVGRIDGTSFVDVTDPVNPVLIGDLPQTPGGPPSPTWRDIKVYSNHAYIVADAAGEHGVQVFDLTQLRNVRDAPVTFEPTALYTRINSAHNIVINEETGFAYVVGASGGGETCGGGLHMVDIREPTNPTFAGCFADAQTGRRGTGYSHDAQCVVYRGPDERFRGREICIGSNENSISIADVTDKANPVALSRASYPNPAYTHQGWFTEDHRYFYVNDETDEIAGTVDRTRTLVWDMSDLEDPQLAREFLGTTRASDHNLYIRDNLMYQSNYRAGLRIIDISDPLAPREVGYLDTAPFLEREPGFSGTWSNYPFFRSGAIGVTSVHEGLFLVRYTPRVPIM